MSAPVRLFHRMEPSVGESAAGFLMRVSHLNGLQSSAELLKYVTGSESATVQHQYIPELAYFCRNTIDEMLQLSGYEKWVNAEPHWSLQSEWLTKSVFVQSRLSKVCPLCLAESAFIRALWSLSFYNHCAWHDCRLIERCPGCKRLLQWDRRRPEYCSCRHYLGSAAQGTRVPSVIELGCAFDNTPVLVAGRSVPKSLAENRQCTLPTALSGDPFLPQIRSTSYDLGLRGNWGKGVRWNVGAFQTDLRDDIYFVAVGNGRGFFNTIGDTRRRGIEMGLAGQKDKWHFNVNYALTDATFEDSFRMISPDNSSSTDKNDGYGQAIDVKPGSRIPGVSLHNLNASVNYAVTDKWTVGLSGVAHSDSYVRGNENNEHKVGVIQDRGMGAAGNALLRPTNNPGTVPGFAVFNFQTSYKLSKEWTATMIVNNIFDREYFTAGRLGRNPFSPSINGAIGPDGYNHNSNDWLSTNFISPGAPRGVWFSLNWHFVPD
jgi:hypothetical protein